MTPLEYAKLCADQYRYEFAGMKIKGNNHIERVEVDGYHTPLLGFLPTEKVCTTKRGGVRHFTAESLVHRLSNDLLQAGLNPKAQRYQVSERMIMGKTHPPECIISPKLWRAAVACYRLTGRLPDRDLTTLKRAQRLQRDRSARLYKKAVAAAAVRQPTPTEERQADAVMETLLQAEP